MSLKELRDALFGRHETPPKSTEERPTEKPWRRPMEWYCGAIHHLGTKLHAHANAVDSYLICYAERKKDTWEPSHAFIKHDHTYSDQ